MRNIHFAQNMLLWECKEKKGSSVFPWHELKRVDGFQPWPIRNYPSESLAPNGPVALRGRWYELVEDYSTRCLTKENDKLPALSGLASKFKDHFPAGKYLAELWSSHLPSALLRKTIGDHSSPRERSRRAASYIAPGWSWASIGCGITYESQRLEPVP